MMIHIYMISYIYDISVFMSLTIADEMSRELIPILKSTSSSFSFCK